MTTTNQNQPTRPYPPTPELDKEKEARDNGSQEIGEFLDWLFWDQGVEFFRRWEEEEPCRHCKGIGHTKEIHPTAPIEESPVEEIESLLHKVSPAQLGFKCVWCDGKGIEMAEREQGGPSNPIYWLRRYFKIDGDRAERERMNVLEWVREQNEQRSKNVP